MRALAGVLFVMAFVTAVHVSLACAGAAGGLVANLLPRPSRQLGRRPAPRVLAAGAGIAAGWTGALVVFGFAGLADRSLGGFPIVAVCLGHAALAGLATGTVIRVRQR